MIETPYKSKLTKECKRTLQFQHISTYFNITIASNLDTMNFTKQRLDLGLSERRGLTKRGGLVAGTRMGLRGRS